MVAAVKVWIARPAVGNVVQMPDGIRIFLAEILRLPTRLRTRTFAFIKVLTGDDDDTTEPRDLGGTETID